MIAKKRNDTGSVQGAGLRACPGWWIVPSAFAGAWIWGWLAMALIGS
jgi:hypothetical protein